MNESKKIFQLLAVLAIGIGVARCGVKGDPLPPDQPPFIGRGHVNYKEAFSDPKPTPSAVKAQDKGDKGDEDKNEDDDSDD